jgi:viologen exporter family transport system ATP-binding protein
VAAVVAAYDVADLSVQEPDIEDVIRELYAR